jgi:hypothetical protein
MSTKSNSDVKVHLEEERELVVDITDDMYTGSLSAEIAEQFVCTLCYGIAFDPIKCKKCEAVCCGRCVPEKKKMPGKFMCYRKCGSKDCLKISEVETNILKSLEFSCQNDECEERIAFGSYFKHMKKNCKIQTYNKIVLPEGMGKMTQRMS